MLRENPPKPIWRGKTPSDNTRFPVKTTLAGKNVLEQHEIPRQNHFGGEIRHEFEHPTAKKRLPRFFETASFSRLKQSF
jgi:hypothetical protein